MAVLPTPEDFDNHCCDIPLLSSHLQTTVCPIFHHSVILKGLKHGKNEAAQEVGVKKWVVIQLTRRSDISSTRNIRVLLYCKKYLTTVILLLSCG
ncbi:hypothetical protein [Cytobacillus sp. IB215665]|uniref:hypothetical protein n=1 Tax=Cytobacillus sp. IB215665 TaxID=3097357 RepID=UPI002A0DE03A|nr:hypothetical protein [Cytobacillus sp. IB215665]MDX8366801.1 hypothetical protein [Cytobacillus sp. IB215665]